MRNMYNQAVTRGEERPEFCSDAARSRREKIKTIFEGDKHVEYVNYHSLPGIKRKTIVPA